MFGAAVKFFVESTNSSAVVASVVPDVASPPPDASAGVPLGAAPAPPSSIFAFQVP